MTQDRRWGYLSGLLGADDAALARMERLSEPSSDVLGQVADLAAVRAAVDSRLRTNVAAARAEGASWEDVARALGVSRQAAQQRYGRGRPEQGPSCLGPRCRPVPRCLVVNSATQPIAWAANQDQDQLL